jgi:hypothetical protein
MIEKCAVCGTDLMSFTTRTICEIKFCRDCFDTAWGETVKRKVKEFIHDLIDIRKDQESVKVK